MECKQNVVIIEEDQTVYKAELIEDDIKNLILSEFVSGVLRVVEEGIEYADVEYITEEESCLLWKIPHKKNE